MKIKDEYVKLPKEMVYKMYVKIVYDPKDYESISRNKMLDDIIKEYSQQMYLYHICTARELEFLKYVQTRKLKQSDIDKYSFEIKELNKKFIFSNVTYEIFEEQKQNVLDSLKLYDENKKSKENDDKIVTFIIGIIKTNANMLVKALESLIKSVTNIDSDYFEKLLGHPLIHFYCDFYYEYIESFNEEMEMIYFRDYFNLLDELNEARKEYGIAGGKQVDFNDYYDMFYYGFPMRIEKVKKMYDYVNKLPLKDFIFECISDMRILNHFNYLRFIKVNEEIINIIKDALYEIPCAAMNGFTPKEYDEEMIKSQKIDIKFSHVPQNNAHLCKNASDQFYKLYFALLDYTNKKYKIEESLDKIYKQDGLDASKLKNINKYLFENKDIIDDFIKENPYNFNKEELDIIEGFKTAVTKEIFVVVGFEREYTEILSDDGKIYMVKGIREDLDKILINRELPILISTTLLMFKGNIVYNSFLSEVAISVGNDMKASIVKDYEQAMKCYHL